MILCKFLTWHAGYMAGEIAGFDNHAQAQKYIDAGYAVAVGADGTPLPSPPPPAQLVDPNVNVVTDDDVRKEARDEAFESAKAKAPDGPPADKQVTRPPKKKGGR